MSTANKTVDQAIQLSRRMFLESGPPREILCDYSPCLKSVKTQSFLSQWGVSVVFCCAYKHAGNGIVERNRRTIKRMVASSGRGVEG